MSVFAFTRYILLRQICQIHQKIQKSCEALVSQLFGQIDIFTLRYHIIAFEFLLID